MVGFEGSEKMDWREMRPMVVRYLTRRTGCAAAAEDLAQDLWLKLRGASILASEIRNPVAYLFRAAANVAFDWHRRERSAGAHADLDEGMQLADERPSPDRECEGREAGSLLRAAIEELPPRCRAAFLLCRVEGLTMRAAGQRLGVSERTIENHLAKATVHCRGRLMEAGLWP